MYGHDSSCPRVYASTCVCVHVCMDAIYMDAMNRVRTNVMLY